MVLPRTETRKGFDFLGEREFLVEFSINGLLAASFFNFLGVPDLFNTADGQSAIGPFGLMDPLGIFAYNGLFPPEPEAWTKAFLGWIDPVEATGPDPITSTLAPASRPDRSDAVRVPISSAEYFLVEHRRRDLAGDGLVLRVYRAGEIVEDRFTNGQEDFNGIDMSGFAGGVVVDADDYDWALPGGLDEDGNPLDGGILVWHVDERVLAEGLLANRVNADPSRRGLDLEEADSAQDIGFPSGNPFAPASHLGSPFDFFYDGNPVVVIDQNGEEIRLYENRFGPDTYPNSDSNDGAPGFVELVDFSAPGATMSFTYRRAVEEGIRPIDGLPAVDGLALGPGSYVMPAREGEYFVASFGEAVVVGARETLYAGGRAAAAPTIGPDGAVYFLQETAEGVVGLGRYAAGVFTFVPFGLEGISGFREERAALVYDAAAARFAAMLERGEEAVLVTFLFSDAFAGPTLPVTLEAGIAPLALGVWPAGGVAVLTASRVFSLDSGDGWTLSLPDGRVAQPVFGSESDIKRGIVISLSERVLYWLLPEARVVPVPLDAWGLVDVDPGGFPMLADVDADGRLDAVFSFGRQLLAITQGGAMADGFPLALPAEVETQPLVARFAEGDSLAVVVAASDGMVYAYRLDGERRLVDGFPLAAGGPVLSSPLLQRKTLLVAGEGGGLRGWEIDGLTDIQWGQLYQGTNNGSGMRLDVPAPSPRSIQGILIPADTYNWPNPMRDGRTFFRVRPTTDVTVRITIVDAAGSLVDRLEGAAARVGVPTDILWQTDAASGIYYARVEATNAAGRTETALIKLAVIR
jgi:hypothetical protein